MNINAILHFILKFKNFWYGVSYLVLLDTIYSNLPVKCNLKCKLFGLKSNSLSLMRNIFPKRPSGASVQKQNVSKFSDVFSF